LEPLDGGPDVAQLLAQLAQVAAGAYRLRLQLEDLGASGGVGLLELSELDATSRPDVEKQSLDLLCHAI
jgi:hypothetical protein